MGLRRHRATGTRRRDLDTRPPIAELPTVVRTGEATIGDRADAQRRLAVRAAVGGGDEVTVRRAPHHVVDTEQTDGERMPLQWRRSSDSATTYQWCRNWSCSMSTSHPFLAPADADVVSSPHHHRLNHPMPRAERRAAVSSGARHRNEVEHARTIMTRGHHHHHIVAHRQPGSCPTVLDPHPGAAGIDTDQHGRHHVPALHRLRPSSSHQQHPDRTAPDDATSARPSRSTRSDKPRSPDSSPDRPSTISSTTRADAVASISTVVVISVS